MTHCFVTQKGIIQRLKEAFERKAMLVHLENEGGKEEGIRRKEITR